MKEYPTREAIIAELDYNRATGEMVRNPRIPAHSYMKNPPKRSHGTVKNGYWFDSVGGRQWPRSVLVWIIETGSPPTGRIRHMHSSGTTRFDTLKLMPPKPLDWNDERDAPAVARHRVWCKRNGVKPIGDGMIARLLDPE